MSPFAMFVLLLTIAYVIYYGVNICRDLFSKKGQTKSDTEEYEMSDDEGGSKSAQAQDSEEGQDKGEAAQEIFHDQPTLVEEQLEEEDAGNEFELETIPTAVHTPSPVDDAENESSAEMDDLNDLQEKMEECVVQEPFCMDAVHLENDLKDENSGVLKTKES